MSPALLGMHNFHIDKTCIAVYGFTSHVNPDGTPSRCDCDYIEYNLYLYDDMTFRYVFQNGRLEPKYETKTGNWKIKNKLLILEVSHRYYVALSAENVQETYLQHIEFETNNHFLCHVAGDICLQRRDGADVGELFLKFE